MTSSPTVPSGVSTRPGAELEGTRCLVTGGLGFIGSAVARRLVDVGASVVVVDSLVPQHGGDRGNLAELEAAGRVAVVVADIGSDEARQALAGVEVVCNVAGQVSHLASMHEPLRDLDLNVRSHLAFLESLRAAAPGAVVVQTSTRQVYGRPRYLPVDEEHPTSPVDVNGVDKLACEQFHLLYGRLHDLRPVVLRLTNVYGPGQHLERPDLGFLPVFIRRALLGEDIVLYGDGTQRRDCLHVDDVVDAIVLCALTSEAAGEIFNLGHEDSLALAEIARLTNRAAGDRGGITTVPFPDELARIDIGSFHGDFAKAKRVLGWDPQIAFAEGIAATVAHYVDRGVVPVVDLTRRALRFEEAFAAATARVLRSGTLLSGPELAALEVEAAAVLGGGEAVGVGSGASALQLALAGLGVGPGDEVVVPAFTAVPTASAVCAVGATPVPVDVSPGTAALDVGAAATAITPRTRAIVVVHLYGRPAPVEPLLELGVAVVEDAAQAHGALSEVVGAAAVYSFYPTKNIGGIGDGGLVVTADPDLAADVRRRRVHGMTEQYVHVEISQNHRLSELEAAWVRLQLPLLGADNARRREIAGRYHAAAPGWRWQDDHPDHVFHLCVARVEARDEMRAALVARGVVTAVHYPLAITEQPAYRGFTRGKCPEAERWSAECLTLPCFPELTDDEIDQVAGALAEPDLSTRNPEVRSISAFFPCYNDALAIPTMVRGVRRVLAEAVEDFEIIVIDDGSSDGSVEVLEALTSEIPELRLVVHAHNRGYGGALLSGFAAATREWVFYTDGDAQYDAGELGSCIDAVGPATDIVQGYKLGRGDPWYRKAIGRTYHHAVRVLFRLHVRDTDCDFRLIRRSLLDRVELMSTSGVICVEMMRKFEAAGANFEEVGVSHFPRPHGRSQFFRLPAIARSARQLLALWWDLMVRGDQDQRSVVENRPDRADSKRQNAG